MVNGIIEFGRDGEPPEPDGRLDAPTFHRNHAAIGAVLESALRGWTGDVLEIGSGTGQHAVAFARSLPTVTFWPTDLNDNHLRSIAAWRAHAGLGNVMAPARLDAGARDWPLAALGLPSAFIAMFCANVIHIAPWAVAQGLFAGAGRHLADGGRLFLYGPFRRDGAHNAPSNAAFDASLRRQNPEWGVRDTADLRALAGQNGLRLSDIAEMPANNAVLTFTQTTSARKE
jgi:SAM-dependent methyltransferase